MDYKVEIQNLNAQLSSAIVDLQYYLNKCENLKRKIDRLIKLIKEKESES